jgi:acylphosphatase
MKKYLVISGKVQGIGFRYWLQRLAIEKNICGWVKNKTSGNVEALIVGEKKEIQELIKLCKMGPGSAKIDYVQINDYNKDYIKKDFDIVKSD